MRPILALQQQPEREFSGVAGAQGFRFRDASRQTSGGRQVPNAEIDWEVPPFRSEESGATNVRRLEADLLRIGQVVEVAYSPYRNSHRSPTRREALRTELQEVFTSLATVTGLDGWLKIIFALDRLNSYEFRSVDSKDESATIAILAQAIDITARELAWKSIAIFDAIRETPTNTAKQADSVEESRRLPC